jgi:hypothetical protein
MTTPTVTIITDAMTGDAPLRELALAMRALRARYGPVLRSRRLGFHESTGD